MRSWPKEIVKDKLSLVLESIAFIEDWGKDYKTEEDFACTPLGMAMLDASIMRLQVIGESIRAIDDMTGKELLVRYSAVPWKKIIGLRNIISHEYANVNYAMIVGIIKNDLPSFAKVVKQIFEEL